MQPVSPKTRNRWRPFRAKNFQTLMYPIFSFCLLFGLFPYRIAGNSFAPSRIGSAYSTFVIIVFIATAGLVLYNTDIAGVVKYDGTPDALQGNCYILLGITVGIVTYFFHGQRLRLFQDLCEVSSRIPAEDFNRLAKYLHAKDICGFLFLIGQTPNVFSWNFHKSVVKTFTMYETIEIFLMDMVYMNCVCTVKACFHRINKNLLNVKELLLKDEPHLLRRVYHEQRNPLLLIELKAIKKRHLLVSDALQKLNGIFSAQIVTTVTLTFAEVTFSLYFYILRQAGSTNISVDKQIWYQYYITSVGYYSIKMILMVWACETAKDQATEIGTTVHDVLGGTTDRKVKDELQLFAMQVLQRNNIFSAKGLTMDATLLTAIVGSITTYLLILIQFLVTEESCELKKTT